MKPVDQIGPLLIHARQIAPGKNGDQLPEYQSTCGD